jgi:hypothetical protein
MSRLNELLAALEDLCGPGAQYAEACDEAEHDESSGCIWCEARAAIAPSSSGSTTQSVDPITAELLAALDEIAGMVESLYATPDAMDDPFWQVARAAIDKATKEEA